MSDAAVWSALLEAVAPEAPAELAGPATISRPAARGGPVAAMPAARTVAARAHPRPLRPPDASLQSRLGRAHSSRLLGHWRCGRGHARRSPGAAYPAARGEGRTGSLRAGPGCRLRHRRLVALARREARL